MAYYLYIVHNALHKADDIMSDNSFLTGLDTWGHSGQLCECLSGRARTRT